MRAGWDPVRGAYGGSRSVPVSRNWQLVFRWDGSDVRDSDFVDYR